MCFSNGHGMIVQVIVLKTVGKWINFLCFPCAFCAFVVKKILPQRHEGHNEIHKEKTTNLSPVTV